MRTALTLLVSVLAISSCTLFKKEISKPVSIKIEATAQPCSIQLTAGFPKYVSASNEELYRQKFITSLMEEGKLTKNVTIVDPSSNADILLEIKNITITESEFAETVNDEKSPMNGQQFYLNKVECSANINCVDVKTGKVIGLSCSNTKVRQEKLKNSRDLGDLITGQNKDHTTYRQKLLRDDIAQDLCSDVGRRIWVPITKRIRKHQK